MVTVLRVEITRSEICSAFVLDLVLNIDESQHVSAVK